MVYVTVTIKMPEELLVLLDSYANNYRISRSEAVRRAVKLLIKQELERDKEEIIAKVEKIKLY